MTDNPGNEDFSLEDESFDNFEKKKGTLGDLWRNNVAFKVGVVIAAAVVIFGTIMLFGSSEPKPHISMVPQGSDMTAPPGTEAASQAYVDAVKEQNEARTEEAQKTSGSSLPTPIEPPVGRVAMPEDTGGDAEDPLQRWRALQEERLERELKKTQPLKENPAAAQESANRQEEIQKLAQGMAEQMQAILDSRSDVKITERSITDPDYLEALKEKEVEEQKAAEAAAKKSDVKIEEIIFPAGQIAYAQLITEANTDSPGPVLAQIAGGVLNGARILGDFTKQEEFLTLKFDVIVIDGISYDISAIALDPGTTLPGMATDVDHHYLKRVVLPMAASFIEGMAGAISESGLTNVTVTGETVATEEEAPSDDQEVATGIDEAGQKLSEILDEAADDTKVTVRIESGTPIGVLFMKPLIKDQKNDAVYNAGATMTGAVGGSN